MKKDSQYRYEVCKTLMFTGAVGILYFVPFLAHAQEIDSFSDLVSGVQDLVNSLIPLVASLALLAFFWGLAKYIFNAGNEEAKDEGKRVMIGGIIALFLIASIGGIIQFMATALDIDTGESIDPPTIMYNEGDGIG